MGRMVLIVVNGVGRSDHLRLVARSLIGVQVHIEVGKVAAGNVQADTVPFGEAVTRSEQVDRDFANLSRFEKDRLIFAFAPAHSNDAIF